MKVLTVKPPWSWAIFHGKDIENRGRRTNYRGALLIQASATKPDPDVCDYIFNRYRIEVPPDLHRGGIVGVVDLTNVVTRSQTKSRWFEGPYGWVLENPRELPFIPMKGQLGIFNAPAHVLEALKKLK